MAVTDGERPRARILVVEDDFSLSILIAVLLTKAGYSPTAVGSVPRARERLEEESFDLVLTDLVMPGESGLDLLRGLQMHGHGLTALVMTASDDEAMVAEALEQGARAVLRKPFELGDLLTAVGDVLRPSSPGLAAA
jgi:DNA-binding response OmpR family regulator